MTGLGWSGRARAWWPAACLEQAEPVVLAVPARQQVHGEVEPSRISCILPKLGRMSRSCQRTLGLAAAAAAAPAGPRAACGQVP